MLYDRLPLQATSITAKCIRRLNPKTGGPEARGTMISLPPCERFDLPPFKAIISTAASVAATAVLIRSVTADLVPGEIGEYFASRLRSFSKKLSSEFIIVIDEFNGIAPNQLFEAATVYLGSQIIPSIRRIKAIKSDQEKELSFAIDEKEEFVDRYEGVKFKWTLLNTRINNSPRESNRSSNKHTTTWKSELKYYELRFNRKHKKTVFTSYLPYILQMAKSIKREKKEIKLHTVDYNGTDYWSCVNLDHPSTFDKIAMDPDQKKELIEDLDRFRSRKDYYKRVGKAWKRGYLLYGPPGTGKSSLIAAIANYLRFDVYDLDLKEVMCNSDLRRLLVGTASKSILVIEDIDCSMDLKNRENEESSINDDKVTLSGLLNFTDGLWSSCGDERIVIFTTNHKDHLDPALLRPGRMDVHIEMSYCSFSGFKILAANYLRVQENPLYTEIEDLLGRVQVTPAEVAGELMKSDDVEVALKGLIEFMHVTQGRKTRENLTLLGTQSSILYL